MVKDTFSPPPPLDFGEVEAAVQAAELRIAGILSALEQQTDAVVDSLHVYDFEITTIGDTRPQIRRQVQVRMRRRPGTEWQV